MPYERELEQENTIKHYPTLEESEVPGSFPSYKLQDGGKRKNLARKKESAEFLTELCAVCAKREESKSQQAGIQLESCVSRSISEVSDTSTELRIIMISDSEVEDVQPASERTALHASNEMCQTDPRESSSKMSRNGNQNYCNGKLPFVHEIMRQIADLPLDHINSHTTALRCQGLLLIQDLSQVDSSLWCKEKLLRLCIASIFALPSVDILQRQDREKANVQQFSPWMKSAQAHERARAVKTYVFLLKFAATYPKFYISPKCTRLGTLIGQLCLCLNDPKKEIARKAMQGMYFLYWLAHQQTADSSEQGKFEICKEILGPDNSATSHQNIIHIIKEFEPFLSPKQMSELLLMAIDCLKEANRHTTAASHAITSVIMEFYKHKLHKQVPEIVDKIYQQLGSIYQPRDRHIMMRVLIHLTHTYMEEVCNALLQCPFPIDRFSAEMWYVLTKACSDYELTIIANTLLKKLQLSPKATGDYITPLSAASAFCKLLSVPKCSDVALYIYPRLLMALLVQLHYNIRHDVTESVLSQEKDDSVRAMLRSTYYLDLQRILYLLVPFLERGDEEHQITATAFFVELLCMSEARRLPDQYSICRLKRGLMHEISVIRALSIKGLINMIDWPGKEVKLLLPAMTKGLSGMDGRLFVESVVEIEALLNGPEGADCICNITVSLQDLFGDKRDSVRASAIYLFGRMVKRSKKSNKLMIRQQILENMIPLFLHLQEENADISKKSKYTLEQSFHFLGWKPPKQIVSWKAWHEHEDVLDETCRYLIQKQEGALQRFLYQGIFYTESPIISIKRASIMLLSFLVLHMDNTLGKEDLNLVSQTLESLMHDSDVSVCMTAAHAHDRISAVLSKQINRLDANNMTTANDSVAENLISNSRSQTSFRNSSSTLFRVIGLWKSANRN